MKRRKFIQSTAQASAATFLFSQLYACKAKKPLSITVPQGAAYDMQFLRGNIGYFTERGGTIGWYAGPDGIVVVDTQFPDQSTKLVGELSKLNKGKVDLLINTHHHGDHTAGNPVFADLTDVILAHKNSKTNQEKSAIKKGTEDQQVYPTDTFTSQITKVVGDQRITLHHFGAGHTNGDAVVHFESENVVHMGDLVFNRRFPYIDMSAGANIESWISVLDKVKDTFEEESLFIFGHAADGYKVTGYKDDLSAFQNYLEKLLEFGLESLKSGKSLDELKKITTTIPGAPQWTGKGIERSLDAVYAELARE